jgi:hypothetical protein
VRHRKIRYFQGFKRGNLTTFLTEVFTLNSDPIRQTLGMVGLPVERLIMVMGNPGLDCGPDLEVAVHNVAEPVTQPKTGLNAGRT